jgi:hypothetical protein
VFLVLEPRVHEDAQDLDMVFGLHSLSLDGEWLLVRFRWDTNKQTNNLLTPGG